MKIKAIIIGFLILFVFATIGSCEDISNEMKRAQLENFTKKVDDLVTYTDTMAPGGEIFSVPLLVFAATLRMGDPQLLQEFNKVCADFAKQVLASEMLRNQ